MPHSRLAPIFACTIALSTLLGLLNGCSQEALERGAQKRTISEIRNYGTVWMQGEDTWRNVEGVMPEGEVRVRRVEANEATILIDDSYFKTIPEDGWGRPLEVWFLEERHQRQLMIRSLGSDGHAQGGLPPRMDDFRKERGSFPAAETEHDIVWVNGEFLFWPI